MHLINLSDTLLHLECKGECNSVDEIIIRSGQTKIIGNEYYEIVVR